MKAFPWMREYRRVGLSAVMAATLALTATCFADTQAVNFAAIVLPELPTKASLSCEASQQDQSEANSLGLVAQCSLSPEEPSSVLAKPISPVGIRDGQPGFVDMSGHPPGSSCVLAPAANDKKVPSPASKKANTKATLPYGWGSSAKSAN